MFNIVYPNLIDPYGALVITLPFTYPAGSTVSIQVFYSTTQGAEALGWLTPANAGESGTLNYVYSQSEDINGRSMIPMQDTPYSRTGYGACVVIEAGYSVFFSANQT